MSCSDPVYDPAEESETHIKYLEGMRRELMEKIALIDKKLFELKMLSVR